MVVVLAACDKPPSDPGIPSAMCTPRCERDHACDATVNVADCVTKCEHLLSPRVVYYRPDWVQAVQACAQRQACVQDTDSAIQSCVFDALRRFQPSPAAQHCCRTFVSRQSDCNVSASRRFDYAHCLDGTMHYTDVVLDKLTDCQEQPCRVHGACVEGVVGEDSAQDDENVIRQEAHGRLPHAGSPTVILEGRVSSSGAPVAGATVCLRESHEPCLTTGASGDYSLVVPAHGEIAVTVSADGFAPRLFALSTVGSNVHEFVFPLVPSSKAEADRASCPSRSPAARAGPSSRRLTRRRERRSVSTVS